MTDDGDLLPAWLAEAQGVLAVLAEAGYEAWVVGGAVRNHVLGLPIHDIDITTNARPAQIMALFPHTVPTGLAHGTVSVAWHDNWFEITTYRTEGFYVDGRRPADVSFDTTLQGDLARRDFTMNAMAMDARGQIVDPFGGLRDIQHGQIRAVGDAQMRMREDGLRVARALRFAAVLQFTVEETTWDAMVHAVDTLQRVAIERRREEWSLWLPSARYTDIAQLPPAVVSAWTSGLLVDIAPWAHALSACPPDLYCRLAFCSRSRVQTEDGDRASWLSAFRFSRQEIRRVRAFLRTLDEWSADITPSYLSWHTAQAWAEQGDEWMRQALTLCAAWQSYAGLRSPLNPEEALSHAKQLQAASPVRTVSDLAVSGRDLIECLGLSGSSIKATLQSLYVAVASGDIANDRDALLTAARRRTSTNATASTRSRPDSQGTRH